MLRQSRSPRRSPCTSTSAVAAFVAKGIWYWSHRRSILLMSSKPLGLAGSQKNSTRSISLKEMRAPICAALIRVEVERDGQPRRFRDKLARHVRGAERMLGKYAAVCDAELDHQFLFSVVCHQCNVHSLLRFSSGYPSALHRQLFFISFFTYNSLYYYKHT